MTTLIATPLRSAMANTTLKKDKNDKRRVYFVEERNTLLTFDQGIDTTNNPALLEELFQQAWEMHDGKQAIKARARQWRKTGLGMLLHDTFCTDHNNGLSGTLCQKQLNTFCRLPDDLYNRGIERYLSRKHDCERMGRKRSIVREVVAQHRILKQQPNLTVTEQWDILGQTAQRCNEDAALFARRMGKADEMVMRRGSDTPEAKDALILMEYLQSRSMKQAQQSQQQPPPSKLAPTNSNKRGPPTAQPAHHSTSSAFTTGRRMQARQA